MEASLRKRALRPEISEGSRLCRNLWKNTGCDSSGNITVRWRLLCKNVLQPDPGYAASSTYKVEYKENPNAAGAYYINEATTWNTMIHTGEFLDGVEKHLQEAVERGRQWSSEALSLWQRSVDRNPSATLPRISVFR